MLMTAALHMDTTHGHGPSPPSSTSPPPPWFPVLADDSHRRDQQLLCDFAAASAPSPTPATAAPPNNHHHLRLRPATRRVSKRRPRPSRKLPTTYIAADPASFRRMVHEVTGADDLPMPPTASTETLCRPAPSRAGAVAPAALMLPTLDTSAFLLGAPRPCAGSAGWATAPVMDQAEAGGVGGGACDYSSNSGSSCGGFPTLDSWDALL